MNRTWLNIAPLATVMALVGCDAVDGDMPSPGGAESSVEERDASLVPEERASASAEALVAAPGDDAQALSCPSTDVCELADNLCLDPDEYWCRVLERCVNCYGVSFEEQPAPVPEQLAAAAESETALSCPSTDACELAENLCLDPDEYWCRVLERCVNCYGVSLEEQPAPAPEQLAAAAESETALSCPSAGTCAKADDLCQDPQVDVYWCSMLERCVDCYAAPLGG